jgi:hypothetical protein
MLELMQGATPAPADTLGGVLAVVGALGTSAVLGLVKGLDTKVTQAPLFRKLQPVITLGGAFAAPWLAAHVGVAVDPSAFAAAPVATVAAITVAELVALVRGSK